MGLDVGDSRIGVALSDPLGIMASPLTIINRRDIETDIEGVMAIAREHGVEKIVIGLPLSMDGSQGVQVEKVHNFAAALSRRAGLPVRFQDERLSTVQARRVVRSARKTDRGTRYDAAAAALILQAFLDQAAPGEETTDN
jgi:putative Holliday junction resolvase